MSSPTTYQRLVALVDAARESNEQEPLAAPPSPEDPLVSVLDSLGLATLVLLVEEEWGIEFEDDDLDPDNLATLDALARFVSRSAT